MGRKKGNLRWGVERGDMTVKRDGRGGKNDGNHSPACLFSCLMMMMMMIVR